MSDEMRTGAVFFVAVIYIIISEYPNTIQVSTRQLSTDQDI